MPSEDSKSSKKESVEHDEEKCIGSLIKNKKKENSSDNADPKSQSTKKKEPSKVKKEEGFEEPTSKKSSNKTSDSKAKVKKEEAEDGFEESKSKKTVNKIEKVRKKVKKEEEEQQQQKGKKAAKDAEQNGKKREKKVYDLPGQKRDPPEERDPLRIFYESLFKQLPESDMATIWMMESGLLSKDKAKEVFEMKQKKAQQQKHGSPMKSMNVKRKADSVTVTKATASSPVSLHTKKTQTPSPAVYTQRKKTTGSEAKPKQSNKRKKDDDSEAGSDDDFVMAPRNPKKQRAS